jgi:tripartite-type tricarboxylate transporter receptor subunit TctC
MHRAVSFLATLISVSLIVTGCSQPAAPASPTQAPSKAAEPTKAQAPAPAQPTAAPAPAQSATAPAKAVNFPEKGKAINIVCGLPAASSMDIGARVLAPLLEKELGTPIQVVNKVGAGGQVGVQEVALAKPDGYTIGTHALPATEVMYLDAERKASFTRKDLLPLALDNLEPVIISVKADSPYKTLKDLVDAAKAKPNAIKASVSGVLVTPHLGALMFEKVTGVRFTIVSFEGGVQGLTAMLGGNVDVDFNFPGTALPMIKGNQIRVLGIMDKQDYKLLPGVPNVDSLGYTGAHMSAFRGYIAPAGLPKEVADILSAAIKKVVPSPEYVNKMAELGIEVRYMAGPDVATYWANEEAQITQLIQLAKSQQ